MVELFTKLITVTNEFGKVTSASLYPNGFIAIDVDKDGKHYTLTYHEVAQLEGTNEDS